MYRPNSGDFIDQRFREYIQDRSVRYLQSPLWG